MASTCELIGRKEFGTGTGHCELCSRANRSMSEQRFPLPHLTPPSPMPDSTSLVSTTLPSAISLRGAYFLGLRKLIHYFSVERSRAAVEPLASSCVHVLNRRPRGLSLIGSDLSSHGHLSLNVTTVGEKL